MKKNGRAEFLDVQQGSLGISGPGRRLERNEEQPVFVYADRYWGASTERLRRRLEGKTGFVPSCVYRALGRLKQAAAEVNAEDGDLASWKAHALARAADDLIGGSLDAHFPLTIYHDASGDAFDTNVNEVLASRAAQLLGDRRGASTRIHPVLDVGMMQSPAASFAAAIRVAAVLELEGGLVPRVKRLARRLASRSAAARPDVQGTLGLPQIAERLWASLSDIDEAEGALHDLPRFDDPSDGSEDARGHFSRRVVARIAQETGKPFAVGDNAAGVATIAEPITAMMGAIRGLTDELLLLCDRDAQATPSAETGPEAIWRKGASTRPGRTFFKDAILAVQFSFSSTRTAFAVDPGTCRIMQAPLITSFLDGIAVLGKACDRI